MEGAKLRTSYIKKDDGVTPEKLQTLRTLPQILKYISEEKTDKEGVVFVTTDGQREVVTFRGLFEKSRQVAQALLSFGLKQKDIVAINLRMCPEWLFIAFGAILADIVPIGISFAYTDGEDLIALMDKLQTCTCLILDPGFQNEKWNILQNHLDSYDINGNVTSARMPSLRYLLCHDPNGTISGMKQFSELLSLDASRVELPEVKEDDIAILFRTSGSTGVPKIVAHTHRSLGMICRVDPDTPMCQWRLWNERHFSWIGGFPFQVLYGQTRVTINEFSPAPDSYTDFLLDSIRREHCNVMLMMQPRLHEYMEKKEEFNALPSLKMLLVAGQPITRHLLSQYIQLCPLIVVSYGGTETLWASMDFVPDADKYVEHCTGPLTSGVEVKIVDSNGETVPVNTQGEVYIRGGKLMKEYFNDPAKTNASFTEDGWYKTDDLGRLQENGSLIVEGKKSSVIISGAAKIYTEIQETFISKCPGVQAVCLVPIPDNVMHQVVCTCVIIEPGSDVDESDIQKYCEDINADRKGVFKKIMKYYLIMDTFPLTTSGKVARKELTYIAMKMLKI